MDLYKILYSCIPSISGGDGTAKSGEGGDDPEENLWPFFNAMCFKGFHDGELYIYIDIH